MQSKNIDELHREIFSLKSIDKDFNSFNISVTYCTFDSPDLNDKLVSNLLEISNTKSNLIFPDLKTAFFEIVLYRKK